MKKILIILSFIAFSFQLSFSDNKEEKQIENVGKNIKVTHIILKDSTKFYYYYFEYPHIEGLKNNDVEKKINQFFDKHYKDFVKQIIASAKSTKSYHKKDKNISLESQSFHTDTFCVYYHNPKLISFKMTGEDRESDATHTDFGSYTYNFNLKNGEILTKNDIFKSNSNYLNILSGYCRKELYKKLGDRADRDWINRGTLPEKDNFDKFTIMKEGLSIIFNGFEVASYAEGTLEVLVPYSLLKDVLNRDLIP